MYNEIIKMKSKYYREQRENQKTSELISCLLEGMSVGESINVTLDLFPVDNRLIDVGGIIEVLD